MGPHCLRQKIVFTIEIRVISCLLIEVIHISQSKTKIGEVSVTLRYFSLVGTIFGEAPTNG